MLHESLEYMNNHVEENFYSTIKHSIELHNSKKHIIFKKKVVSDYTVVAPIHVPSTKRSTNWIGPRLVSLFIYYFIVLVEHLLFEAIQVGDICRIRLYSKYLGNAVQMKEVPHFADRILIFF